MDPDRQFPDPISENENEEMLIDPNQMDQPDDNLQMIDPADNYVEKSVDIKNEPNIPGLSDGELVNDGISKNENIDEDGFISDDDQNSPRDNVEKVKALSEKEEDREGNLEDTTANIAMSLLPQNNKTENDINDESADKNISNDDKSNIDTININELNEKDNKSINDDANVEKELHNDENEDENKINDEDQINNENNNIIENSINENNDEKTNNDENTVEDENQNTNNIIDKENTENEQNTELNNNEDEGHTSEEGMEVKDNLTPQRFTREKRPISSFESLSKLPPLSTDPDLDAENLRLLNNFKKKGRLPDVSQRTQLFQYIQREKVNNVIAQKFGKAQEFQNLLQKYQKAIIDQEIKERNQEKIDTLKNNLETIEEDLKNTEKETKNKIGDEKEKQKEHYYELLQRQDQELNSFERKWNDPTFIQKYAKPSSALLAMKNKERSMVLTKMFDQAEDVQKKVRELEKKESHQAQELAENEMKKEKQKILAKQDSEIETYRQHCTKQIEMIKRNHEIEKNKKVLKIAKLKEEIQELQKNPPTALPPMAPSSQDVMMHAVMTPRTLKRYSMYKMQSKKPVLTLNPLKNVRPSKKSRSKTYSSLI